MPIHLYIVSECFCATVSEWVLVTEIVYPTSLEYFLSGHLRKGFLSSGLVKEIKLSRGSLLKYSEECVSTHACEKNDHRLHTLSEGSKTENPETKPYIYVHLIFNQCALKIKWGKKSFKQTVQV